MIDEYLATISKFVDPAIKTTLKLYNYPLKPKA